MDPSQTEILGSLWTSERGVPERGGVFLLARESRRLGRSAVHLLGLILAFLRMKCGEGVAWGKKARMRKARRHPDRPPLAGTPGTASAALWGSPGDKTALLA